MPVMWAASETAFAEAQEDAGVTRFAEASFIARTRIFRSTMQ